MNEALRTRGKEAESVILKELGQMLEKKVWTPVDIQRLPREEKARIIRSSMFLKEKFLASGEFEKLKARLVAGGDQQDKTLYDDLSAPTVGTSSVFTLLCIAAHEGRKITVIDISGAYLNADMNTGLAVHMRLDKNMTGMMVKLAPHYSKYTDDRGCVVVKIDKALYGCVESATLCYTLLREPQSEPARSRLHPQRDRHMYVQQAELTRGAMHYRNPRGRPYDHEHRCRHDRSAGSGTGE